MATHEFALMSKGGSGAAVDDHFYLDTISDTKTLRFNSRDFIATSGDINAMQSKPNISVGGSTGVCALEVSPRVASGITTTGKVVGIFSNPLSKGTTGNVGTMRAFEGKVECPTGSTKTTTNCWILEAMNAMHGTVTNGPTVIKVNAAGGNKDWEALMELCDNGGAIADLASAVTTVNGAIKVIIGTTTCYIPTYASYTAS